MKGKCSNCGKEMDVAPVGVDGGVLCRQCFIEIDSKRDAFEKFNVDNPNWIMTYGYKFLFDAGWDAGRAELEEELAARNKEISELRSKLGGG